MSTKQDQRRLVAVASDLASPDAMIIKSFLENMGLEAHIRHADTAAIQPGVRAEVLVRSYDADTARQALASQRPQASSVRQKSPNIVALPYRSDAERSGPIPVMPDNDIICPACGTNHVEPLEGKIQTRLPFYQMTVKPQDKWYLCQTCGAQFQNRLDLSAGLFAGLIWALLLASLTYAGLVWLPRLF